MQWINYCFNRLRLCLHVLVGELIRVSNPICGVLQALSWVPVGRANRSCVLGGLPREHVTRPSSAPVESATAPLPMCAILARAHKYFLRGGCCPEFLNLPRPRNPTHLAAISTVHSIIIASPR